ncbi:MOK isoform 31, partial [Pongo abelii]
TIPMRESPPTRPCSTPTSKNRETVPRARGGPSQETRTSLCHGTAQTKAFGSGQTVVLLQPHAAVRAWIWNKWKSAGAETLEVHPCEQEGSAEPASLTALLFDPAQAATEFCVCNFSLTDRSAEGP